MILNFRHLQLFVIFMILLTAQDTFGGKPSFQRPYTIKMVSYVDEYSHDIFKSLKVGLTNQTFSGCFMLNKDIKTFDVRAVVTVPKIGGTWTAFNTTLNGCGLLASGGKLPTNIIQFSLKTILASSHQLPDRCPIQKDTKYCFGSFTLDSVQFPRSFPPMNLNVVIDFIEKKLLMYKVYLGVEMSSCN
ncbi:uncharacterized protein LOC106086592 isoform X1 [Stomoxys calcitrans]|uniref:uncharacterized protein LOC106086592 isoform X1 n=1 Tax=Stomoxys calcitrans TaxID=35570 RepID=UPI0027E34AC8|nr:uncharacterized protein LOC106086592 isoform X1 [Stomoxys calcitrans]